MARARRFGRCCTGLQNTEAHVTISALPDAEGAACVCPAASLDTSASGADPLPDLPSVYFQFSLPRQLISPLHVRRLPAFQTAASLAQSCAPPLARIAS